MSEMLPILSIAFGLFTDVLVGIVVFVVTRKINKSQQRREEFEKEQREAKTQLELLHLQLVDAGNSLSFAVAMAVKRGTPNGEIEEGIKRYRKAEKAYNDYLKKIGLQHFEQEENS